MTDTQVILAITALQYHLATGKQEGLQDGLAQCEALGIEIGTIKTEKSVRSLVKRLHRIRIS